VPETVIPLAAGETVSSDDWGTAECRTINWFVDTTGNIRPRFGIVNTQLDPGFYARTSGTLSGIIGTYVWRSAFDRREYLIFVKQDRRIVAKDLITNVETALSDGTLVTQLDGSATQVVFAEDTQRLIMAGGGELQIWTGNTASLSTRISATTVGVNEPPLSATHVVSLANYLVANQAALPSTNNRIYWSGLGDSNHTTWSPLNFNTADADADPIVALGGQLREVVAFGTKTTQVFGIGVDPTLPFSSSAAISLGCSAAYSVIKRDNDFALLDDSRRFVTTDGRSHNVISDDIVAMVRDPAIFPTVSDCLGFRYQDAYWDLLCWVFPAAQRGFAYDQKRQAWFQLRGWNGVDDYAGIRINCFAAWPNGNLRIVGDPLYENLWTLDPKTFTDQGPALTLLAERTTDRLDHEFPGRKRCAKVRFYVKRGQSTTTPPLLDVAVRDDDGPWSSFSTISLGVQGDYVSFKDWFPGGIYRRRQYRVRYSGGVDMAISSAVEYWEPYGG
jgi:hypothetical protein